MDLSPLSVKLKRLELVGLKVRVTIEETLFIPGTLLEGLLLVDGFFCCLVILCLEAQVLTKGVFLSYVIVDGAMARAEGRFGVDVLVGFVNE